MPRPAIFTPANFAFASVRTEGVQQVAGSLYFASGDTHRRIRLVHNHGPKISNAHADAEWYFPASDAQFNELKSKGKNIADVDDYIRQNSSSIPDTPAAGHRIIEYWGRGGEEFSGRHPSRGTVAFQPMSESDITLIYDQIIGGATNDTLLAAINDGIDNNGISTWLRQ